MSVTGGEPGNQTRSTAPRLGDSVGAKEKTSAKKLNSVSIKANFHIVFL
jgi:hypothetical protein